MNNQHAVVEDASRLHTMAFAGATVESILGALREDKVVLVRGVSAPDADRLLVAVTGQLGLREQLRLQSTFASIHGHRTNVGQNFMSVNQRSDYQFIPAHSEGTQRSNMQLASLYCFENTTDGGESILMNTNPDSPAWSQLRALNRKIDLGGRTLSAAEVAAAKMMYQINIPEDLISADDEVLREHPSPVPGIRQFDVLTRLTPSYSCILERDVQVYWDNVASIDFDAGEEYLRLLRSMGLVRVPPTGEAIEVLDNAHPRRMWRSGIRYDTLFRSKVTHKLSSGDLLIQNNLTWTHSTANWTPHSGQRTVAAAFA